MQIKLFKLLLVVRVISGTFLLESCPTLYLYRGFFIPTEFVELVLTIANFVMIVSLRRIVVVTYRY